MKVSIIIPMLSIIFIMIFSITPVSAYPSGSTAPSFPVATPSLDRLDFLKDIFLSHETIDIGTSMPSLNLLNTDNLSGRDFGDSLKAIAVLAINLALIVIQTVAGVLKALLPFLG